LVFEPDRPLMLVTGEAIVPILPEINLPITAQQIFDWLPDR
jgi:hypothetical protein